MLGVDCGTLSRGCDWTEMYADEKLHNVKDDFIIQTRLPISTRKLFFYQITSRLLVKYSKDQCPIKWHEGSLSIYRFVKQN